MLHKASMHGAITTSICYGWFFNSTYISFPARMLSLAVLAKSEDHRVFITLILLSSEILFCKYIVIMNYISTFILKIISIFFSCLLTKIHSFCFIWNQICVLTVSTCLQGKKWSRVILDTLHIEKKSILFLEPHSLVN